MELLAEEEGYSQVPVDIEQFIEDPKYLGLDWGGVHLSGDFEGRPRVYPMWRRELYDIYPNPFDSPYEEIAITGSIGIGKSTVALLGVLYDLYRLLLFTNPQEKYGLSRSTILTIALFTATKDLGSTVLYGQLMEMFKYSPFFQQKWSPRKKTPSLFEPGIGLIKGSQIRDTLGTATIAGIIDEANFQDVRQNQVIDVYNGIKRRMQSRFLLSGGRLPFRLWIVSSKKDNSSFLEDHINKNRSNPKTKIIEAALWEAQAHLKEKWSGITFPVFCGDNNKDPIILASNQNIPASVDSTRIIHVPIEFRNEFELDILGSLRDIAGKSTTSKFKLFRSREQLEHCTILDPAFTEDVISLSEEGEDTIKDFLSDAFWKIGMKDTPHFIHLDAAKNGDRFGIAMCHAHGVKEVKRLNYVTGKYEYFQELIIHHDLAVGIRNKPGEEIPYWKIREFLIWLRTQGFNLGSRRSDGGSYDKSKGGGVITSDGYMAMDNQQLLKKQGFEAMELSVDRTKDAYLAYKRAVIEGRVLSPRNEILINELLDVEDIGDKFDHTKGKYGVGNYVGMTFSKDISDSIVGSFWSCQQCAHSSQLYSDRMVAQMKNKMNSGSKFFNHKVGSFIPQ
jgi:hypothetical protein